MADGKQVPLSIILRLVDKATGGMESFNKKLEAQLKPARDFKKLLSNLDEKFGVSKVTDGFRAVGGAITDLVGRVAMVGGVVGVAVAGVLHLVGQFSELGHVAKRAGVEVDFLAGLRYAATKAGLPVEQLDEALITLTQNLGQAKTGTGRMVKFLQMASPALLHQLVNTHSTAEATGLLIDAMAKLPDAARRAALAQKTFGDSGLVLLAQGGSKAVQEQMAAYAKLAPSMEGAVAASHDVKEAMHDLDAATDGVKAVLVTGLAPALGVVIEKMTAWLVGHRADIARWADDIGKRIPGAVEQLVTWVGKAFDEVTSFVDGIGGWKTAALALGVAIEGPLIASIAALSIALVATPFGQVLLGLTAIVAAVVKLTGATEDFESVAERLGFTPKKKRMSGGMYRGVPVTAEWQKANGVTDGDLDKANADQEAMMADGRRTAKSAADAQTALDNDPVVQASRSWDEHQRLIDQHAVPALTDAPTATEVAMEQLRQLVLQNPGVPSTLGAQAREIKIKVDFANAPKGMRATVAAAGGGYVDMTTGFQGTGL